MTMAADATRISGVRLLDAEDPLAPAGRPVGTTMGSEVGLVPPIGPPVAAPTTAVRATMVVADGPPSGAVMGTAPALVAPHAVQNAVVPPLTVSQAPHRHPGPAGSVDPMVIRSRAAPQLTQ